MVTNTHTCITYVEPYKLTLITGVDPIDARGMMGQKGAKGENGTKGDMGPKGSNGTIGDEGFQGQKGEKGMEFCTMTNRSSLHYCLAWYLCRCQR